MYVIIVKAIINCLLLSRHPDTILLFSLHKQLEVLFSPSKHNYMKYFLLSRCIRFTHKIQLINEFEFYPRNEITYIVSLFYGGVYLQYTYVKKNVTNVPQRHLKTWHHVCRFSSTMCAAPLWLRRSALSCKALQSKNCDAFCCENAARSPNCDTFGKNRGEFGKMHCNPYSRTNPEANHKSAACVLIKKRCTNFTNCCILFDVYHMY